MAPKRKRAAPAVETNPDANPAILDGKTALRASPDAEGKGEVMELEKVVGDVGTVDMDAELEVKPETPKPRGGRKKTAGKKELAAKQETGVKEEPADSELSELENVVAKDFTDPTEPASKKAKKTPTKASRAAKKGADEIKAFIAEQAALKANGTPDATPAKKPRGKAAVKTEDPDEAVLTRDPGADEDEGDKEDVETEKKEAARPPPVNSDYLPLPWKGRLGYVRTSPILTDHKLTLPIGMSQHLSPLQQPSSFLLAYLPYPIHPRPPAPAARPVPAGTRNEKPPGQDTTS